jgi:hypothetical protein
MQSQIAKQQEDKNSYWQVMRFSRVPIGSTKPQFEFVARYPSKDDRLRNVLVCPELPENFRDEQCFI